MSQVSVLVHIEQSGNNYDFDQVSGERWPVLVLLRVTVRCVSVCVVPVVRESAQVSLWAFLVLTRLRMCPDLRAPWNTCDMRFGL